MNILVADVGGTNTRLAVAVPGGLTRQARFANDDHASFPDLLRSYALAGALPALDGCCIAIAGPVGPGRARLTNRDWSFEPHSIAAALPQPPRGPVRLINDLAALGHALAALGPAGLTTLLPGGGGAGNGQSLVVGLGTGFNVCVVAGGARPLVLEAEMGHASLPETVAAALRAALDPAAAAAFATNEDLFSGRGLTALHAALSGRRGLSAPKVLAAAGAGAGAARQSVALALRLLGLMTRELVFAYMPLGGIHLAGSVARGLLGLHGTGAFQSGFAAGGALADLVSLVPVRLIADDAAALTGAARAAMAGPDPGAVEGSQA